MLTGQFVRLPSYPWQRERYWLESEESIQDRLGDVDNGRVSSRHPLLGKRLNLALSTQVWEGKLASSKLPYLKDHCIQHTAVFPGAGYIEMALAAAAQIGASSQLTEIEFQRALPLFDLNLTEQVHPGGETPSTTRLQLVLSGDTIDILSQRDVSPSESSQSENELTWVHHARSRYLPKSEATATPPTQRLNLSAVQDRLGAPLSQSTTYEQLEALGLSYGPTFQGITDLWHKDGEVLTKLHLHSDVAETNGEYQLHPVVIDLCLQSFLGIMTEDGSSAGDLQSNDENASQLDTENGTGPAETIYLPIQIDQFTLLRRPDLADTLYCHAWLSEKNEKQISGDIHLYTESGELLMTVEGLRCQAVARQANLSRDSRRDRNAIYEVKWQPATSHRLLATNYQPPATNHQPTG
ncbi:polyketide synthase dehydratase domain-containing protein [Chloroflexi bacterium TSY]|nr:polyketide synthase dehydratase domain-containing protein [Chloroflexi bacterium TSY]